MSELQIRPGALLLCNGRVVEVVGATDHDHLQVKDVESNAFSIVTVDSLARLPKKQRSGPSVPLEHVSQKEQNLALKRFKAISSLMAIPNRSTSDVERTGKELNLSVAQTYRLMSALRDGDDGARSLIRNKKGRRLGTRMLDPWAESLIDSAVNSLYMKSAGCNYEVVFDQVKNQSINLGKKPPSRKAVLARIKSLDPESVLKSRGHKKMASDLYEPRPGKTVVSAPLEVVQMDHCLVDLIIVDELTRRPLCRPWLTAAIDLYTRVLIGFHLTLAHPSGMNCAHCVAHSVLPKNEWLKANKLELSYPFYGLIKELRVDNAKEFRALTFKLGCKWNNILLKWRPVRTPHFGGHIERLIGTCMGHIHLLPGTTNSSIPKKGEYDSEHMAVMTFSEFREWFTRDVAEVYHRTPHRALDGLTPMQKWQDHFTSDRGMILPPLPGDKRKFFLDFLPLETRPVHQNGIVLNNIRYWCSELSSLIGRKKHIVKYDRDRLQKIFLRLANGNYIDVPYADLRNPDVTLSEWEMSKKLLREQGMDQKNAKARFMAILENRTLVENSTVKTKRARKIVEHQRTQRDGSANSSIYTSNASKSEIYESDDSEVNYEVPAIPSSTETLED